MLTEKEIDNYDCIYFKDLLGQILSGDQKQVEELINIYIEDCEEYDNFNDLTINEAITFLYKNYQFIKDAII